MTGVGSRQWIHFLCQDAHSLLWIALDCAGLLESPSAALVRSVTPPRAEKPPPSPPEAQRPRVADPAREQLCS